MKTIYKYELIGGITTWIEGPAPLRPMSVGLDPEDKLCVWCAVDDKSPVITRPIQAVGTGQEFPMRSKFLGSVTHAMFEWHIFDGSEISKKGDYEKIDGV
jgi:hypothetical protein